MKLGKFARLTPTWGSIQLSKHKFFEYQLESQSDQPFELSLRWTQKRDHAGINFRFSVYKLFWIGLDIYDHRHWDHDRNQWVS